MPKPRTRSQIPVYGWHELIAEAPRQSKGILPLMSVSHGSCRSESGPS
jgi:hypothetical protein